MSCRDTPVRTDTWIDRDGLFVDRALFAMHLAMCAPCRTYVRSMRITRDLAAASLRAEIPDGLAATLDLPPPGTEQEDLNR
ncbi:MAG TPA: hypothetical protein VMP03_02660 [Methylomirabilota bacterium]|nr:hypothetical protein [Methylomirabilota bacterium]